jgi:hypothetical protein
MISPHASFSVPTTHHHFEYTNPGYPIIAGSGSPIAPPSPVKRIPNAEIQGGISIMGFINGYPPQNRKHTANPKSAAKKKKKNNKVLKNPPMKSSKNVKAGKRGSRSEQSDDDDDATLPTGSVTLILDNLGLTSSVLKREPDAEKQQVTFLPPGVDDPIKQTDRMLANLGLTKFVTK